LSKAANSEAPISRHEHQVDLPYEVRCTQLRKSARVNLESLPEEVPITLYLSMGGRVDGTVIDISASGGKFRVNKDLSNEIKNLQVLDTCRISLPDDSVLQAGVQLMGMTVDQQCDATTLRCHFSDILSNNEEILEEFIANTQDQAETSELAVAS
ncbi:MAG: PilZ domain-containing protein, partial [Gammaproteobacteria bacterium]|nr:PilZ domain-containing protein [Gammaproteobacteria bacterium]